MKKSHEWLCTLTGHHSIAMAKPEVGIGGGGKLSARIIMQNTRARGWECGSIAAAVCLIAIARAPAADKPHDHREHLPANTAPRSPDAPPPAGYEKVDHELVIGTVPGRMVYDTAFVRVRPGAKVKLVLKNNDDMQHNLVICNPGQDVGLTVSQAAWALGADALAKHFVPDSPLVLHHTLIVNPHQADTIYFTAPRDEGDYPFVCTLPGHVFTMAGVMQVGKGGKSAAPRGELRKREADWYYVRVTDRPRVVRCSMPDSSSRSIAVGLPGGTSYCFDAEGCFVRYGWTGEFLDAGPDRGRGNSRGGGANRPLGERCNVGTNGFPLRIGSSDTPKVVFRGYRTEPAPVFLYSVDGVEVAQSIAPARSGIGLTYTFELPQTPLGPVRFIVDTTGVATTSDAGEFENGRLTIPADRARKFSVTIVEAK